ncbi:MAG: hypothetical protein AAGC95_10130 [Pseudomonadota bacterium]
MNIFILLLAYYFIGSACTPLVDSTIDYEKNPAFGIASDETPFAGCA